jgi:hypothetical protein
MHLGGLEGGIVHVVLQGGNQAHSLSGALPRSDISMRASIQGAQQCRVQAAGLMPLHDQVHLRTSLSSGCGSPMLGVSSLAVWNTTLAAGAKCTLLCLPPRFCSIWPAAAESNNLQRYKEQSVYRIRPGPC